MDCATNRYFYLRAAAKPNIHVDCLSLARVLGARDFLMFQSYFMSFRVNLCFIELFLSLFGVILCLLKLLCNGSSYSQLITSEWRVLVISFASGVNLLVYLPTKRGIHFKFPLFSASMWICIVFSINFIKLYFNQEIKKA